MGDSSNSIKKIDKQIEKLKKREEKDNKHTLYIDKLEDRHIQKSKKVKELISMCKEKFQIYYSKQIKKVIHKNCLYYSSNDEYLNFKNLKDKIEYDLKKLNYNINFKKNDNDITINENYQNLIKVMEEMNIASTIKEEYNSIISEKTKKIINIKDEHFENLNKNKTKVFSQFFC